MSRAFQKQEAEKAANNICFAYFNIQVPPLAPIPPLFSPALFCFPSMQFVTLIFPPSHRLSPFSLWCGENFAFACRGTWYEE